MSGRVTDRDITRQDFVVRDLQMQVNGADRRLQESIARTREAETQLIRSIKIPTVDVRVGAVIDVTNIKYEEAQAAGEKNRLVHQLGTEQAKLGHMQREKEGSGFWHKTGKVFRGIFSGGVSVGYKF